MANMTEAQVMHALRNNIDAGFDTIFNQLFPELCYYANKIIDDTENAKDIVTNAFVGLWKKEKAEFENMEHVRRYLFVSTRNGCNTFIRNTNIRSMHHKAIGKTTVDEVTDYYARLETDIIKEIYDEIERLPLKCKEVFKLTYMEGMKRKQVAEKLNISEETVKNHNVRALRELRLKFSDRQLSAVCMVQIGSMIYSTMSN